MEKKFNVIWTTKSHILKNKEFLEKDKKKALKLYRSKDDATLWFGEQGNYEDYFKFSWISEWGSLKEETEIEKAFDNFIKYVEKMILV